MVIKELRKAPKLSRAAMAEKPGTEAVTVSRLETGAVEKWESYRA